jgi:spore coat protein U-like protein
MNIPSHRLVLCAALLLGQLWFTPSAIAATSCSATSPGTLSFGSVSLDGQTDAMVTFNVTCSTFGLSLLANAKVRMCLSIGDGGNGGGNFDPRRMVNTNGDPLQFQLYTDAGRSQIWGSLGNPTVPTPKGLDFDYAVPLLGGSQTLTVTLYGRVPSQILTAGGYSNPFTGVHTAIAFRYNETLLGNAQYPASCVSGGIGGSSFNNAFPFTATATVPANCRAYVTTDLDFGNVPGLIAANKDQTSTIAMTCTGRTAWNVGLNNGLNPSGSVRRMRLGATASYVNYELYRDTGRTHRWGATIGTDTVPGTGTGGEQTLTVYGRVPAGQAAAAGSYSDTITVTISY